jgi:ABC-type phosphate transport system ATPase subunit
MKSTYCEYILEKILSTSEVGPILALIAPSPLVNSTFIKIIDQFSETNVEAIVNGTDVDNSNEYEPNQNLSNSNSEENLLYYNDTSVNIVIMLLLM